MDVMGSIGVLSKSGFHEWVMNGKHHPFSFELNKFVVSKWHLNICLNFESSLYRYLNSWAWKKLLKECREKN